MTQFIPSTGAQYGIKYGGSKPAIRSQVFGAAHYLSDLGGKRNIRQALGNYYGDPSSSYAGEVLQKAQGYRGIGANISPAQSAAPATQAPTTPVSPTGGSSLMRTIANLSAQAGQLPETQAVYQTLAARQEAAQAAQAANSAKAGKREGRKNKGGAALPATGGMGNVSIGAGADRPGVRTNKAVLNFLSRVSGIYGRPLTIGTGSNHSQYTTSGNVSDHWDGNAADTPASGKALTKLGQAALIAAGMKPSRARRIKGGLFNIGGWQIIFNTNIGGDHWDHLHTGRSH